MKVPAKKNKNDVNNVSQHNTSGENLRSRPIEVVVDESFYFTRTTGEAHRLLNGLITPSFYFSLRNN